METSGEQQNLLEREQSSRVVLRNGLTGAGQISRWAVITSFLAGAVLLAAMTRHVVPRSMSLRVTKLVCWGGWYQGCEEIEPWPQTMPSATDYPLADALQEFGKDRHQIISDFKEMIYGRLMAEIEWKDEAQQVHWSLTFLKENGLRETTKNRPWIFETALSKNSYVASLMCDFDLVSDANRTQCDEAKGKLDAGFTNPQQAYMWNRMGFTGGHYTWNRWYTPQQCYQEALWRNGNMASAWNGLGEELKEGWKTTNLWGRDIREVQAYVHALKINPNFSEAWTNMGDSGGGTLQNVEYSQTHCYLKALMVKPDYAPAWRGLGDAGGFHHKGKDYSAKDCIEHALKLNPSDAKTWVSLSKLGGGMFDQKLHSKQECLQKALDLEPPHMVSSQAWKLLGMLGGGTVNGTVYDARGCYQKGLDAFPDQAELWVKLGDEGGGKVKDQDISSKDCYVKAISMLTTMFNKRYAAPPKESEFQVNGSAWLGLGDQGGGMVGNRWVDAKTCYAAALWNQADFSHAWVRLGDLGGARVAFRIMSSNRKDLSMKSGDWYDKKRCGEIAAEVGDKSAEAFASLGWQGGGNVSGKHYDTAACFIKALELNSAFAPAWNGLSQAGGGKVNMQQYSAQQALQKAIESKPDYGDAWIRYCNGGGGFVSGVMYDKSKCYSHALDIAKAKGQQRCSELLKDVDDKLIDKKACSPEAKEAKDK
eukprot:TRINITY_DN6236_c0_g2_i1.p1 TRINITY_DN6236_c0_g2~~TRINITY_DN6236_c0_g2_i1.p1  ORF type:complete len:705 (+),score=149.23 TRINITY_DN6236_c0_g2_i1:47-2161(+)